MRERNGEIFIERNRTSLGDHTVAGLCLFFRFVAPSVCTVSVLDLVLAGRAHSFYASVRQKRVQVGS